jgi:hypothetical protein
VSIDERTVRLAQAREHLRVRLQSEGYTPDQIQRLSKHVAEYTAACVRVELATRETTTATKKFTESMNTVEQAIRDITARGTYGRR